MCLKKLILFIILFKILGSTKATEVDTSLINRTAKNFDLETTFILGSEQRLLNSSRNTRSESKFTYNKEETLYKAEGEFCRRSFDGRSGYCILAYKCLHVMREHREHGVKVDYCKRQRNLPVICCPLEEKLIVTNRISLTKCKEYHSAARDIQLTAPRQLSGKRCVSSVPMIVGGEPTQTGAYSHMAAMGWTQPDNTIHWGCGGFLISEQFVVTAAHCVTSYSKPMDIVRLGALKLNETTKRFKRDIQILTIILPSKYKSSAYYEDIALLKLARRVRFSDRVRPACLWQQPDIPTKTIVATGWGRTKFMGPQSNDLLKVDLNIFEQSLCKEIYQKERRLSHGILDSQFCAGHVMGGKDTCQGDSGGPVHIEVPEFNCIKFVVGVTSFGKSCAAPNTPGVYTKIYEYIDWIEDVVFGSRL